MEESLYWTGWLLASIGIYWSKKKKSRAEYFVDVIPSVVYGLLWPIVALLMVTAFSPFVIDFRQDRIDKLEQRLKMLETVLLLNGLLIDEPQNDFFLPHKTNESQDAQKDSAPSNKTQHNDLPVLP